MGLRRVPLLRAHLAERALVPPSPPVLAPHHALPHVQLEEGGRVRLGLNADAELAAGNAVGLAVAPTADAGGDLHDQTQVGGGVLEPHRDHVPDVELGPTVPVLP